jgi:hypothetical protein
VGNGVLNMREPKWEWCKMTCNGGSERGECPCVSPPDCELRFEPEYEHHHKEAVVRLFNQALAHYRILVN